MSRLIPGAAAQDRGELSDRAVMAALGPYLWPKDDPELRFRLGLSFVLLGVMAGLNALAPLLFARLIDHLSGKADPLLVVPVGLILAYSGLLLIAKLIAEARWALYSLVEQRFLRRLSRAVFAHLQRLSLRYHLDRRTGMLARIIDAGLKGAAELIYAVGFMVLPFLVEVVTVAILVFALFDLAYAAVLVVTLATFFAVLVVGSAAFRARQRLAAKEAAVAQGKAVDGLFNFETVKLFAAEQRWLDRYDSALAGVETLSIRATILRSATGMVQIGAVMIGLTALTWMAASDVAAGRMSVGELVLINAYLLQLVRPLERLGSLYRGIKTELANVEQLMLIFGETPDITDRPAAPALPAVPVSIRFEQVGFAYHSDRPILDEVSFTVEQGQKVALVGPSGSGKSTIARLLLRLYDADSGRILVNGADVRDITQASLRAAIGVAPQDPVLFNDTLAFNVGIGDPDAGRDRVLAAIRSAQLDGLVGQSPDGVDVLVGERGLKLSGGEKQRVSLARLILKDAPILLLDEATSSLDSQTEAEVLSALSALGRGRTQLVIAHRLATVADADRILVLRKGRIVEQGTHAELLANNATYAKLWTAQHKGR